MQNYNQVWSAEYALHSQDFLLRSPTDSHSYKCMLLYNANDCLPVLNAKLYDNEILPVHNSLTYHNNVLTLHISHLPALLIPILSAIPQLHLYISAYADMRLPYFDMHNQIFHQWR